MSRVYKRVVVHKPGGPDALEWEELVLPAPRENEISIKQEAMGVEFIDTQLRSGQMPAEMPTGIGFSAVGTVIEVGSAVTSVEVGDRVAYSWPVAGAYAEMRNVAAERAFRLPDQNMPAATAAGALFRGLTAWYLATRLREIKKGDFVLVHAVAGGVGQILVQWLKHLGAIVIGTAGSEDKLAVAKALGVDYPMLQSDDFAAKVAEITGGKKCAVVYDSVGKSTFAGSLDSAARFGLVVSYGWVSGDVGGVSLPELRNKGSLFVTRPTVSQYTADAEDFRAGAEAVFGLISSGVLKINVGNSYSFEHVAQAHTDLVNRKTRGSVVLTIS